MLYSRVNIEPSQFVHFQPGTFSSAFLSFADCFFLAIRDCRLNCNLNRSSYEKPQTNGDNAVLIQSFSIASSSFLIANVNNQIHNKQKMTIITLKSHTKIRNACNFNHDCQTIASVSFFAFL